MPAHMALRICQISQARSYLHCVFLDTRHEVEHTLLPGGILPATQLLFPRALLLRR
jgi:hypothetical protein